MRCEVGLSDLTALVGAIPTGDGEQRGHAAVGRAIGVPHESRFANRPVRLDEGRNSIPSTVLRRERDLRIHGRARPTNRGLQVTPAAAVQVHPRSQAFVDLFSIWFIELFLAHLEIRQRQRARLYACERSAGASWSAAYPGVAHTAERLRRHVLSGE